MVLPRPLNSTNQGLDLSHLRLTQRGDEGVESASPDAQKSGTWLVWAVAGVPARGHDLAHQVNGDLSLDVWKQALRLSGNPDLALQAVIEDPCSPPDDGACRAMFDELRSLQAAHLPF